MVVVAGWDIGGVHIKAARVVYENGVDVEVSVVSRSFEIWRDRNRLIPLFGRY